MRLRTTSGINSSFPELSPSLGQVAYVLRTRSPLSHPRIATLLFSLDLHVLTTPPAFTLSQNQTLRKIYLKIYEVFNVLFLSDVFFPSRFVGLFSKLFAKKIFGRFAQSYLVNFKEHLSPYLNHRSIKTATFCKWKGWPLGHNPFTLSRTFFEFFYFFFKYLSTLLKRTRLPNLKRPHIKPFIISVVNTFF